MSWWSAFRDFDRKYAFDINRYVPKGYFSKWIIRFTLWTVVAYTVYVLVAAGLLTVHGIDWSSKKTFSCPSSSLMDCRFDVYSPTCPQDNPFCKPVQSFTVARGSTVGDVPPPVVQHFGSGVLTILIVGFVVNHVYYRNKVGVW